MRLGGWHRLWIVVVVLYGMALALLFVAEAPVAPIEPRPFEMVGDDSNAGIDVPSGDPRTGRMIIPENAKLVTDPELIRQLNEQFAAQTQAEFQEKLRSHYRQAALVWAIPSIGIYLFGWSIGWIVRGFRQRQH